MMLPVSRLLELLEQQADSWESEAKQLIEDYGLLGAAGSRAATLQLCAADVRKLLTMWRPSVGG